MSCTFNKIETGWQCSKCSWVYKYLDPVAPMRDCPTDPPIEYPPAQPITEQPAEQIADASRLPPRQPCNCRDGVK